MHVYHLCHIVVESEDVWECGEECGFIQTAWAYKMNPEESAGLYSSLSSVSYASSNKDFKKKSSNSTA